MRIFVTGATGFIGSAVVAELIGAGHQVTGLARSDAAVNALAGAGAQAHRGELTDIDSLAAGARACDGVAHLAFIHDFAKYRENGEIDRRAVVALADVLAGSHKPLVIASGVTVVPVGRLEPNGKAITWTAMNIFRFASDGKLAEEWVQTDYRCFLEQLTA